MGKKSRRKNKNNGGPLRQKGLAAVETAATTTLATIYETICQLMMARKYDEILKVESKYRHLDTFGDDPVEDVYVLYAFGRAKYDCSKGETCMECVIYYYERAKERMKDENATEHRHPLNSKIGMHLALLYSDDRDMEKAISSYRWLLVNCNRHNIEAGCVNLLSRNFNQFKKFEYTIEVLEGSMDMMETFDEKIQARIYLIHAYIGCGEFLKAKAAHKKRPQNIIYRCVAWPGR